MARGDLTVYEEFANQLGNAFHNFESAGNTFKVALFNNSWAQDAPSTASPAYAITNEVSGTSYTAGGATLASQTYNEVAGVATFNGSDVVWTSPGSGGPPDIYWAQLYNFTHASSHAVLYVDMGGPVDLDNGDVTISWHTSGIFTVTVT